jgi:hypothetical protein
MYFIEFKKEEMNKMRMFITLKLKVEYKMCLKRYFVFYDLEVAQRVASKYGKDILSLSKIK